MTCIAGLVDKGGKVWMGGDSAALSGWDLRRLVSPKVFRVGPFLIGGTGEMRTLQAVRYYFQAPTGPRRPGVNSPEDEGEPIEEWVAHEVVDALRSACQQAGYARKNSEQEYHDGAWLLGYKGRLFLIDTNYGVSESDTGYDSVGCGDQLAMGVLYATDPLDLDPYARIELALRGAEMFSAGVRAPFTIECLEG